ncbi:hypothetical protein LDENG_00013320 [Lucifuga dentata]|nr:hypothetical protein LDENG_00013320 [Lucifuga dentata]
MESTSRDQNTENFLQMLPHTHKTYTLNTHIHKHIHTKHTHILLNTNVFLCKHN